MHKSTTSLVALGLVVAFAPTSGAEAKEPTNLAEAIDYLAAMGLLDKEILAASTVTEFSVDATSLVYDWATGVATPGVPMALPAIPLRVAGCAGMRNTAGFVNEPPGVTPACPFKIHGTPIWASTLVCVAPPGGFSICFSSATNIAFLNFGVYSITCLPQGPLSVAVKLHQQGNQANTMNCFLFGFGSNPTTWMTWIGSCGGFGGVGAWSCAHLLK